MYPQVFCIVLYCLAVTLKFFLFFILYLLNFTYTLYSTFYFILILFLFISYFIFHISYFFFIFYCSLFNFHFSLLYFFSILLSLFKYHCLFFTFFSFQMCPRISIRGCVHSSVGPSVSQTVMLQEKPSYRDAEGASSCPARLVIKNGFYAAVF